MGTRARHTLRLSQTVNFQPGLTTNMLASVSALIVVHPYVRTVSILNQAARTEEFVSVGFPVVDVDGVGFVQNVQVDGQDEVEQQCQDVVGCENGPGKEHKR